MDNNNTSSPMDTKKVNLIKEQKIVESEQVKDTTTTTLHSHETTNHHSYNIFNFLINKIRGVFNFIITIIIIFVIAGLLTGNLKSWTKNILYYSYAALHTAKNFSFPHHYEDDSPEYILSKYINALFAGDQYTANQYINTKEPEITRATDIITNTFRTSRSDTIGDFLIRDMSKADYEITVNNTENMTYSITFTTYDYQIIKDKAANEASLYDTQILINDSPQQSDEDIALKILKTLVYKAPKNLKFSVEFTIEKIDGSYKITNFDPRKLVCAMTGNLILSLDENYLNTN